MVGAVVVLLVIVVVGPIAVMLGGALLSALVGRLLSDDADRRASGASA